MALIEQVGLSRIPALDVGIVGVMSAAETPELPADGGVFVTAERPTDYVDSLFQPVLVDAELYTACLPDLSESRILEAAIYTQALQDARANLGARAGQEVGTRASILTAALSVLDQAEWDRQSFEAARRALIGG